MPRELDVIYGPMFSGKTDALIARFEALRPFGARAVAFKPSRDTRYADDRIVSHSGREIPAVALADVSELERFSADADAIFIDEIQFFDPSLRDSVSLLRGAGLNVIAAGLDLDFSRTPFETTQLLIKDASCASRLMATCARCGQDASVTQRLANGRPAPLDSPRFVVGDAEIYEPRCERCWAQERAIQRD